MRNEKGGWLGTGAGLIKKGQNEEAFLISRRDLLIVLYILCFWMRIKNYGLQQMEGSSVLIP